MKTQYGYHIIEPLTRSRAKSVQPLAKVKQQIRQEAAQTEKNKTMTEWVKDTREDFCDGDLSFQVGFKPNPDPCKSRRARPPRRRSSDASGARRGASA